ncbi:hypothetical protein B0T10DRAFT_468438 [Thelonectria olida]|uniref:Uncharacterized protein n=1 Tax=Thelonectria olida TaxID=1576542 RepID=A0A9P8WI18_9HYPO|nr:hypothetical protein B0T10DRAFT_468438 [Thelonectria olida]
MFWPLVFFSAYLIVLVASTSTLGLATDRVVRGQTVQLTWTGVSEEHYPLSLQARFFNDTPNGVFSIRATIANGLTGTSFEWKAIPAPLDYFPTARYELILVPEGANEPRVGYEGLFRIVEAKNSESDSDTISARETLLDSEKEHGDRSDNKESVALGTGIGLGFGIPLAAASAWWLSRRKSRSARAKGILEQ